MKRTTLTQIWLHEGYAYAWWGEYGTIGWAGIAIALVAIVDGVRRRRVEVILLALFVAILLGEHGSFAPYHLLRSLPMRSATFVCRRATSSSSIWLALLVALAGHDLFRSMILRLSGARRQIAAIATALVLSLVAIDLISTNGIAVGGRDAHRARARGAIGDALPSGEWAPLQYVQIPSAQPGHALLF